MKKTLILTMTVIMLVSFCFIGYAENGEYSFSVTDYVSPASVRQSVDRAYRETGTGSNPVYYKYSRQAEALTEDLFESCYTYLCHGTGEKITDVNHNMLTFNFALPVTSVSQNDTVYLSFWYRSGKTFTGKDSNTYNGEEQTPQIMFNSNDVSVYEVSSASTELSAYAADGNWHKAEYFVPLTEDVYVSKLSSAVSNYQMRISFLDLDCAAEIQFAGMKCGVLKVNDGKEITVKKAATYLGKALASGKLTALNVNGTDITVSDSFSEYTVPSDSADEPLIIAESNIVGGKVEIQKNDISEYELHIYSPGYDTKLADDAERSYVKYVSADGVFDENAEAVSYSIKNSEHYSVIKVFLDVKTVTAELKVNGIATNLLTGCVAGDKITLDEKYTNIEGKALDYISLIVIKNGNNIEELYSFKTAVSETESTKMEKFEVVLGDKDYSGKTADFYIIDLSTNCDIIK